MYGKETRTFDSHRGFFVRCHTNIELSPRLPLAMTGIINGRYAHNQNSVDRWLQPTNLTVSLNRGCDRSVVSDSYARKTWYSEAIPVPKSASGKLPCLLVITWLVAKPDMWPPRSPAAGALASETRHGASASYSAVHHFLWLLSLVTKKVTPFSGTFLCLCLCLWAT
jgi:hypothetical protein